MLDVDPLADIIGSKLRTGRVPQIVRALGFSAQGMQDGLRSIDLLGDPRFRCDPATDDFYLVLIRAREQLKRERDQARRLGNVQRARQLDADQKAIKLVASSATHGIFLETNLVPVSKPEDVRVYSGGLRGNLEAVDNLEIPGTYFHPLLSTLITSAGRLMLAIAEELVYREQLDWAFCDTDSMALVQTDLMSPAEFIKAGMRIQSWFEPLNPTPELRTFFEFKDENFTLDGTRKLKPLLGTAISSKQHVLFNMDENNQPIIRKATRHGLGHLVSPYSDDEAPLNTPTPIADLRIPRWIHDVWLFIITAMLDGTPHRVLYNKLPGFDRPAVRMTVISTPEILEWFELAEVDNTCAASPFGRILAFIAARDQYGRELSPVAPYQADLERAAQECTDRRTGEHITVKQLKTYADVLGPFQMRSEPKCSIS